MWLIRTTIFELLLFTPKINLQNFKFILGVNSKSSNIVVLSELGRFPIYFNIVLSMISYLHRLHHCSSNFLKEAFLCNNNLHENNIQTWYSSVIFLLEKKYIAVTIQLIS